MAKNYRKPVPKSQKEISKDLQTPSSSEYGNPNDAAEGGQLQLNVMEPVIAQCLFESVELLANACTTLADKCIKDITANAEHTKQMVLNSIGLITFLNPYIGHHMGDIIGKEAVTTGKTIQELVLEKKLLSKEKLDRILSIDNLMHPEYNAELHKK